jgi:drug/metabolite transporter (DMT)-like permease
MNGDLPKNKTKKVYLSYIALLVVTIIWAAATPIIKSTLDYIPLFTFLFFMFFIVCILLLPFTIIELKKNPVDKKDFINFVLLGITSQTSILLIFAGLKYTSALDSAVISVIAPLLSVAAGHYFFKEKVNKYIKIGVILASLGTVLVVLEPIFTDHAVNGIPPTHRVLGNFLVVLYTLAFLMYIIWSKISLGQKSPVLKRTFSFIHLKPMTKKYSEITLSFVSFYIAFASFLPFALLENFGVFGPINFSFATVPTNALLGLLYMAVLSSIVAYTLFEWALKVSSVTDTAVFSYLSPIFTLPFAYMILGETPSPVVLIGSLIIGVGVVIAERRKS